MVRDDFVLALVDASIHSISLLITGQSRRVPKSYAHRPNC